MKRCIIVGAGAFDKTSWKYKNDDYLIAADGGYDYLKELKIIPVAEAQEVLKIALKSKLKPLKK